MLSGFGGGMLINSTQIWTCHLQCDSLSSATQRWRTTNHHVANTNRRIKNICYTSNDEPTVKLLITNARDWANKILSFPPYISSISKAWRSSVPTCFRSNWTPIYYIIPWAHPSPQPKWRFNRLGHFCTAHRNVPYILQRAATSTIKIAPSHRGIWTSYNTWSTPVLNPNGISVSSAIFAGICDRPTDRPTDRQTTLLGL